MYRKIFTISFFLIFGMNSLLFSQLYIGSVGARLGNPLGGSAKYFVSEWVAVEAIFGSSYNGLSVTGLMKKHYLVKRRTPLFGYYGAGAHVGFWDNNAPWVDSRIKQTIYGIDGVLGMEYIMDEAPITVSVDWIPSLNINSPRKINLIQLGITARFYFY